MFVSRCFDAARCARPPASPCHFKDKTYKLSKDLMTFAYYAGPEAVKGLQRFHDKREKVSKKALKKLEGIILPEFYKKMAAKMQEEKTTLTLLQNTFDNFILEQWVPMHLDHSWNSQYVRTEKRVGRP